MSLPTKILDVCNTDDGASRAELLVLTGAKYTCLDAGVRHMVLDGRLFQVKLRGRRARYFAFEVDASTWQRKQQRVKPLDDLILEAMRSDPRTAHTGRGLKRRVRSFGVTSIHEALRRLHERGMIGHLRNVGYFIDIATMAQFALRPSRPRMPVGTPATAARARAAIQG